MEAFLAGRSRLKQSSADKTASEKSSSSKLDGRKRIPWVEKYRPRCVGELSHQDEVVSVLKKCVEGVDLPNLLFYGPPGTGKTSAILALAREMFDADIYKSRVLELNASDERGIQVIRDKVKTFAQISASSVKSDGKPCPPFKIVILDEADSMTSSAQAALRRTMERESKTTRFCLICNYISRIIEPLTSRCSKFRFKPLSVDTLTSRLAYIREQEKVNCTDEVLQVIVEACEGDLRKAITLLQSAHRLRGDEEITQDDILEIAGIVPPKYLELLIEASHSNSYDRLEEAVKDVIAEGFSATQIISQLHDLVVEQVELTDKQKSIICERIGLVDKRLSDGADEYLQLMDLCSVIMTQFCQADT